LAILKSSYNKRLDAQELVNEGEELGVLMGSLSQAGAALEAGRLWEQEAAAAQIHDLQQYDIYPHEERQSLAWVSPPHPPPPLTHQ